MRQQKSWIFSAYLFLVLFSGWSFSAPTLNENDFKVLVWTNKVLFTTFSVSYADKERRLIHPLRAMEGRRPRRVGRDSPRFF